MRFPRWAHLLVAVLVVAVAAPVVGAGVAAAFGDTATVTGGTGPVAAREAAALATPAGDARGATLAAGAAHTCAIRADGTPACWGLDLFGEVADAPDDPVRAVSSMHQYTCAIRTADSKPVCWGEGGYPSTIWVPAPDEPVVALSVGGYHACAIRADGTPVCWGNDGYDRLKGVPDEPVIAVAAGAAHTCAIRAADRKPICWGNDGYDQLKGVPDEPVVEIAVGVRHACAIRAADRKPICWGNDGYDQLKGVPDEPVVALSAGGDHTCAIRTDGTPVCWGDDTYGLVRDTPAEPVVAIAAGRGHTCAIRTDGTPVCWGADLSGVVRDTPAEPVVAIAMGAAHACAIRVDGTPTCWGFADATAGAPAEAAFRQVHVVSGAAHHCAITADGTPACWGDGSRGQLQGVPTEPVVALAAGAHHTCALLADRTPTCWGDGSRGQLQGVPAEAVVALTAGFDHACALRADRSAVCWGSDAAGQVGSTPTSARFAAIAAGGRHTCGVRTDGAVQCWGDNSSGQVAPVPAGTAAAIVAGGSHSCAIRADGAPVCWGTVGGATPSPLTPPAGSTARALAGGLWHACGIGADSIPFCWGDGAHGQLVGVPAGPVVAIAAGDHHSCAIGLDGGVVCWGGDPGLHAVPTERFVAVSLSTGSVEHGDPPSACGVTAEGFVACWPGVPGAEPPAVDLAPLAATAGQPYTGTVTTTGGGVLESVAGLPPGLSVDLATGQVSGTPTWPGTYTVEVEARNLFGRSTTTLQLAVTTTPSGGDSRGPLELPAACDGTHPTGVFADVDPADVHAADIDCAAHLGLTAGTTPTTFDPTGTVTRGQAATFLANLLAHLGTPLPEGPDAFADDDGDTHEAAINALAAAGILRGVGDGLFAPGAPVTRGQLATMLAAAIAHHQGGPLPPGPDAFADDDGDTHEAAINALTAAGILQGLDPQRFEPGQHISRAQLATLLVHTVATLTRD